MRKKRKTECELHPYLHPTRRTALQATLLILTKLSGTKSVAERSAMVAEKGTRRGRRMRKPSCTSVRYAARPIIGDARGGVSFR
jgi:hypothetical protein